MQVDLKGQLALVTGGANGIGRAIATALAANGANVAIVDREIEAARATAAELSQTGARVEAWQADVGEKDQVESVVAQISERLGPIGILVNNAGGGPLHGRRPIHEFPDEDWESVLKSNLTGTFLFSRAVGRSMVERKAGRIVNIASIAGMVPLRMQASYCAAKAGVINLTQSMALEMGPFGVLSNCVCPGSTLTRGTRALFYSAEGIYTEKAAAMLAHVPLGRPGQPEEIASAVLFLVAPEASYINGAILPVDGGWTAGYTREF